MHDELYDRYLDQALQGRLHNPRGYLRRHGVDDPALLRELTRLHTRLTGHAPRTTVAVPTAYPDVVGGFALVRPLGRGGFGEVFEARDADGATWALKLVRFDVRASAERRQRLIREGRAARALAHPGLVRLHQIGREDAFVYLVMELVPGQTLEARVRQEPPGARLVTRWGVALARALQYMHEQGYIHRDVKPANVMIRPDGAPVLLDFGLVLDTLADLTTLTCGFVGTPAYAAPEQGLRTATSPRSDLYSLAATLWFALTGAAPRAGAAWEDLPGPSARVAAVLQRALAERPAERPTAEDFARTLEELDETAEDAPLPLTVRATGRTLPPATGAPPELPGEVLPFVLGEPLGKGGSGVVYRAIQTRLDRPVAVKVLERDTPARRSEFLIEALLGGRLEHPNVLPVHDLLTEREGAVQMAMKLVEGATWAQRLAAGSHTRDEELEILATLCNAVGFAHSRGVLHNDIKPSNVLLGAFGEVLLGDWGVAVEQAEQATIRPRTRIAGPCGTPAYMSPELARGDGAALSPRSDIYQLGAILHEILTGRPPNSPPRLDAFVAQAPAPALEFPLQAPSALVELCRSALDVDPSRRPQSAQAFQARLRDFARHRESLELCLDAARRLRRCEEQAREGENERLYRDFSAVVASFAEARRLHASREATSGLRSARLGLVRAALERGDYGLAATELEDLAPADAEATELRARLAAGLRQRGRDRRARRLLRIGAAVAGLALLVVWVVIFVLRERDARRVARSYEAAQRYADVAMDGFFRIADSIGEEVVEELGSTRNDHVLRELREATLASWRELLAIEHGLEPAQRALLHARVARLALRLDPDTEEAARELARAEELVALLAEDHPARLECAAHRATWLVRQQRWQEAAALAKRGLESLGDADSAWHVGRRLHFLESLAHALDALGDLPASIERREELCATLARAGAHRYLRLQHALELADAVARLGTLAEARGLALEANREVEAWLGERDTSTMRREIAIEALWLLSTVEARAGLLSEARTHVREALAHCRVLRARDPHFAPYRRRLAELLYRLSSLSRGCGDRETVRRCRAELEGLVDELDGDAPVDRIVETFARFGLFFDALDEAVSPGAVDTFFEGAVALLRSVRQERAADPEDVLLFELETVALNICTRLAPELGREREALAWIDETWADPVHAHALFARLARLVALIRKAQLLTLHRPQEARATISACLAELTELRSVHAEDQNLRLLHADALRVEAALAELAGEAPGDALGRALALLDGADHRDAVVSRAEILIAASRAAPADARALLARALATLDALEGPSVQVASLRASALEELGWCDAADGDFARALDRAREAGVIRDRHIGLGPDALRRRIENRTLAWEALDRLGSTNAALEVAAEAYRDGVALTEEGPTRPFDFHDFQLFASVFVHRLRAAGRHREAIEAGRRGFEAGEALAAGFLASPDVSRRGTQLAQAVALAAQAVDETALADAWHTQALAAARAAVARWGPLPALESDLALVLAGLSETRLRQGDPRAAALAADEAVEIFARRGDERRAASCRALAEEARARDE